MFISFLKQSNYRGILDTLGIVNNAVYTFSPLIRLTGTYKGNKLLLKRISDNTTDYIHTSDYDSLGAINSTEIATWSQNGDVIVDEVYSEVQGAKAYQTVDGNKPKIVESGVFLSNGLKFDGSNDIMAVDDYSAIQITNPPFSIYKNIYPTISNYGYVLSKNTNSFDNLQFGIRVYNSYINLYMQGNMTEYNTVQFINNANNKYIVNWQDKNTDGVKGKIAENTNNGTANITLTNRPNLSIGARSEGVFYYKGYIKTILIFNSDEYANYTNFVNSGI